MKSFLEFLFTPYPDIEPAIAEFSVRGVFKEHRRYFNIRRLPYEHFDGPPVPNTFVGPAIRAESNKMGKDNCTASSVVWLDYDKDTRPVPVLPASCTVWSGHGYHLYWKLDKWHTELDALEKVMIALEKCMGADPCHNIDRIMRIPGTVNNKDPSNPKTVDLIELNQSLVYSITDIIAMTKLGPKVTRKILNGDMRGFKSRSDRDWAIVRLLLQSGMSDDAISLIFRTHSCGDKYRDANTDGPKYLAHTIERARESTSDVSIVLDEDGQDKSGIRVGEDGYYATTSKGSKRISTFKINPKLLLEGDDEDFILCDVSASGTSFVWRDEVLPTSALATRHTIKRWCTKAAWIWLGRDSDVEALQIHLITRLQDMGMPHVYATHTLGLQRTPDSDEYYYVANNSVMNRHGRMWRLGTENGPIMYVDQRREVPVINLGDVKVDVDLLRGLSKLLPKINDPDIIWPMIGWFMATPIKPSIEELGYRFPILNVFGTRGSGKTTTILRVFHPLLGYVNEHSYDANTTRFVTLVLLGSTYSVPIAFSEFRVASVGDFTRYILLAYDTGSDPRGRADQTTVDYPLRSPFSIDGEDMVEDSASLERIIAVRMAPASIAETTSANAAFGKIGGLDLNAFTSPYIRYAMDCDLPMLLDSAEQDVFEAFPMALPNRIRGNLVVVWSGIQLFSSFMQKHGFHCYPKAGANVLQTTLSNVFSVKLGRASTEADAFIELIVNAAARGIRSFPYLLEGVVMWFQLAPAFEYYMTQRTHQRRDTLGRGAIATQLGELVNEYMLEPVIKVVRRKKVLAYGVDLKKAAAAGLDLPRRISQGEYTIIMED